MRRRSWISVLVACSALMVAVFAAQAVASPVDPVTVPQSPLAGPADAGGSADAGGTSGDSSGGATGGGSVKTAPPAEPQQDYCSTEEGKRYCDWSKGESGMTVGLEDNGHTLHVVDTGGAVWTDPRWPEMQTDSYAFTWVTTDRPSEAAPNDQGPWFLVADVYHWEKGPLAGAGCWQEKPRDKAPYRFFSEAQVVFCPRKGVDRVVIDMGNNDDAAAGSAQYSNGAPVDAGLPQYSGEVNGGAGNDSVGNLPGPTVIDGGPGNNTASFNSWVSDAARPNSGVHASLDGVANDGSPDDPNNNVLNADNLTGSEGPDILIGNDRPNQIYGGPGDVIYSLGGDDKVWANSSTIYGGAGNDNLTGTGSTIYGDAGNDYLDAPGGTLDGGVGDDSIQTYFNQYVPPGERAQVGPAHITCGEGFDDVIYRTGDAVGDDCEYWFNDDTGTSQSKSGSGGGGSPIPSDPAHSPPSVYVGAQGHFNTSRGSGQIQLRCTGVTTPRCVGAVKLSIAGVGGAGASAASVRSTQLGRGSFQTAKGRSQGVRVPLGSRARRLLSHRRSVRALVRVELANGSGPPTVVTKVVTLSRAG